MERWNYLLRAHDYVWRDRRWLPSVRIESCRVLIQKMLELGELKNGEYPLLTEEGWNRMIISGYPNELDYVNVQLQMRGEDTTSFMWAFCTACLRADSENYELLRPGLHVLMQKFPADPKRLAMEREDSLEL